jgi:nicotinamide-nucleotide amidase
VASAMAKSVRKIAASDLGIGITGIAGPTGATENKPVGTVFIAVDTKTNKICKKFLFKGNRLQVRKKAASKALELLTHLVRKI